MKKISNTTWRTHSSCWSLSSLTRTTQIRHLPMWRLTHKHIFLSKAMNSHLMCSYINIILHLCLSGVCRMNSDVYISSSQTDAMQRYKKKKNTESIVSMNGRGSVSILWQKNTIAQLATGNKILWQFSDTALRWFWYGTYTYRHWHTTFLFHFIHVDVSQYVVASNCNAPPLQKLCIQFHLIYVSVYTLQSLPSLPFVRNGHCTRKQ